MVGNNQDLDPTLDALNSMGYGYVETGDVAQLFGAQETTPFNSGDELNLQQRYGTAGRFGLQLAQEIRRADDAMLEARENAERQDTPAFRAEQLMRAGNWIMFMRKEKINPSFVEPVTRQEIVGAQNNAMTFQSHSTPAHDNSQYNLPNAA